MLLLTLAVVLVVGLGRLLGSGSDGSDGSDGAADETARLAEAPAVSGSATGEVSAGPTAGPNRPVQRSAAPAQPSGPCADDDVAVTPEVTRAVAGPGNGVTIALGLRSTALDACTWQVSPRTLTLKITSGSDDIWSSRECPRAVPVQDVVVRRDVSTQVTMEWKARRSNEDCSRLTDWALPGWYHVAVAALSGEPAEVQFELTAPVAPTVTATPEPTADGSPEGGGDQQGQPSPQQPAAPAQPTGEPSGAVEPDQTSG